MRHGALNGSRVGSAGADTRMVWSQRKAGGIHHFMEHLMPGLEGLMKCLEMKAWRFHGDPLEKRRPLEQNAGSELPTRSA
jgi:hypothetical protein